MLICGGIYCFHILNILGNCNVTFGVIFLPERLLTSDPGPSECKNRAWYDRKKTHYCSKVWEINIFITLECIYYSLLCVDTWKVKKKNHFSVHLQKRVNILPIVLQK